MSDVLNEIARELLCPLSKTLAIDPVLCQDGYVYEREALEGLRRNSKDPYCVPFTCQSPFHSKLKCIFENLVSSGEINDEYLGGWADNRQGSSESAAIETAREGAAEGDTTCMINLGEMYLKGDVVGRNEEEAYAYFERASEEEDEIGTVRKADCLLTGTGVIKDFQLGYETLVEAAMGERSGEYNVKQFILFLLMSSLPTFLLERLVHATLRLMYFYAEGIFGFEQKESASAKWEMHMKKISPHTTEEMLNEMMSSLKETLSAIAPPCSEGDETTGVENEVDTESDSNENGGYEQKESTARGGFTNTSTDTESDSGEKCKKCVECNTWKPQADFTASQWKKNSDTLKCRACVSKLPASQTLQLKKKRCCSCGVEKAFEKFSFSQWRKREGERKCYLCVTRDHIPSSSV